MGDNSRILESMYSEFYRIALLFIPKREKAGRGELESREDLAHDAAAEIIKRYLERPEYRVGRNFKKVIKYAVSDRCRPKRIIDSKTERATDLRVVL
jgi:hypothetical protein